MTESIIGKWFAQGGQRREKVVLATKVYEPISDPNDGPNDMRACLYTKSDVIWKDH